MHNCDTRASETAATQIADLFNEMAGEYDQITDFWYAWLFSRLHYFLAFTISKFPSKMACLDVGCGTGFQTNLLSLFGHDALGIDIAGKLLDKARKKRAETYLTADLFESPFSFVRGYSEKIRAVAGEARGVHQLGKTEYLQASAISLPVESESQDFVICGGSTLSSTKATHREQALTDSLQSSHLFSSARVFV